MISVLTVRDDTLSGTTTARFLYSFPREWITVRELIRERIYQEVHEYNLRRSGEFAGLVQPTEAEARLDGYTLRPGREIDWREQFDRTCEAFERTRVLVLVGDRQATSLDETIEIVLGVEVAFLKLVPLVGG
jgi:hypothetical protein